MEKRIYQNDNLFFISKLYLYFLLINSASSLCNATAPFLEGGKCVSICPNYNLDNSPCKLNNPIIKEQLLTKIISVGNLHFRFINFAENLNGDLILLTSAYPSSNERKFYGIKNNGRPFFKNGTDYFYSINVTNDIQDNKYETQSLFIQLSEEGDDGKEYLLSYGISKYTELYDFEHNIVYLSNSTELFGVPIFSYKNSFFKLSSGDKYYYILTALNKQNNFYIKKFAFVNKNLNHNSNLIDSKILRNNTLNTTYIRASSCYENNQSFIVCFLIKDLNVNNWKLIITVYDLNSDFKFDYGYESINYDNNNFIKAIHFKENIGIFCYYLSFDSSPIIQFLNIKIANNRTYITNYCFGKINLGISTRGGTMSNDMIKMNNNTICLCTMTIDKTTLYLFILKIYGENDSKLSIRYYSINFYQLYNNKFNVDITIFPYNNFISLGFSFCIEDSCDNGEHSYYSSLLILSYANSIDYDFNLYTNLIENNITLYDLCLDLKNYTNIENNLFGFIFYGIKILKIPKNIKLESCLTNQVINENDILNETEYFRIALNKSSNQGNYTIEFASALTEPNYEKMMDLIFYKNTSFFEIEDDYNKLKNIYIGKTSFFTIYGLNSISLNCDNNLCDICKKSNKSRCISCKFGGVYNKTTNEKICYEEQILKTDSLSVEYENEKEREREREGENKIEKEEEIEKQSEKKEKEEEKEEEIIKQSEKREKEKEEAEKEKEEEENEIGNSNEKEKENDYDNEIKQIYDILLEEILNGEYKNKSKIIYKNFSTFQISKLEEQYLYENSNISTIDLGECGKKLKENGNDNLILFKIDIRNENLSSIFVQYEIFDANTSSKIDLKLCENISIFIGIPSYLDSNTESLYDDLNKSGYNLFNSSDDFYNDICSTYTSKKGTDVILSDRRNLFFKDISFCQQGCEFISYNITTKRALCDCQIQINPSITTDVNKIDFNKTKLLGSFYSSVSFHNLRVALCYKLTFSLKGQIYNIGSYIIIAFMLIFIIMMIIYCSKDYKKIDKYIMLIIKLKKQVINKNKNSISTTKGKDKVNKKQNEKSKNKSNKKNKGNLLYKNKGNLLDKNKGKNKANKNKCRSIYRIKKGKNIINKNRFRDRRRGKTIYNNKKKLKKLDNKKNNNLKIKKINIGKMKNRNQRKLNTISFRKRGNYSNSNLFLNSRRQTNIGNEYNFNLNLITSAPKGTKGRSNKKQITNKLSNKKPNILRDDELNILEYKEALKLDKRNFFQYYISLVKLKNPIAFTFFHYNDYNLSTIKISLFFMNFALYFVTNALFFNDKSMHKIFIDNGEYDFVFQIAQTIYSSLVSVLITTVLNRLSLSDVTLLNFKKEKKEKINVTKLRKGIKTKFCLFFVLGFILFCVYWYYISCFCAVYKNTQIIFIKNILISYGLSMIYPFGIYLMPTILRIFALKSKKKDKEFYYKISLVLALL